MVEDQIFKMHNLTDFEKVLFLEKQMKDLIEIARDRGELVHALKHKVEELEVLVDGNKFSRRVSQMKAEQRNLIKKISLMKSDFESLNYRHARLVKDKSELEVVEFYSVEGKGQGNLFSTAEGDLWVRRTDHVIDSEKNEFIATKWIVDVKLKRSNK